MGENLNMNPPQLRDKHIEYANYPPISLAIPNAKPAAMAPIMATFNPPLNGGVPVNLLLKYPNMNKQIKVTIAEILRPFNPSCTKKYGLKGINPPTMYEAPILKALLPARLGSGFSNPNSCFIIKSAHRSLSLINSSTAYS